MLFKRKRKIANAKIYEDKRDLYCTINRIVGFPWNDGGTDVEDELPTAAVSPNQIVVPAIPPAGTDDPFGRGESFDLELAKVICEVSVLPSLVTPLVEVVTSDCATVADYAPPAVPPVESVLELPECSLPDDLGGSWMPDFVPGSDGTNTDEGGFLQSLREPLPLLTETPPNTPMVTETSTPSEVPNSCGCNSTPVPSVSPVVTEGVVTAKPGPDLSREGPFDACDADHDPGQSPIVMDSMAGCQYRMTSYEERMNVTDMDPLYGIHMHDPRVIEYMGAPESARLLGRTPEYWLEHMGRERTIQAALRLHHDVITFMYDYSHLKLPVSFNGLYRLNHEVQDFHETRQRFGMYIARCHSTFSSKLPLYYFPRLWNEWSSTVLDHPTRGSFRKYVKATMLSKYQSIVKCDRQSCQQCNINKTTST